MRKPLVDIVNDHCLRQLGTLPDLANPTGYNDKVNWLKLYDQMPEHVICCNKLLARAYVAERTDPSCLLKIHQIADSPNRIDFDALPERYVLKANHDSGSAQIIADQDAVPRAKRRIRKHLGRAYGLNTGEWAYAHISPFVFAEEYMHGPVIDYKFHCSLGRIFWVQVIADRASGTPRETILDDEYATLPLHMDHKMIHEPQAPSRPPAWDRMKAMARTLSEPFRYVRVDLYDYQERPVFGELTFWPLAGCYKTSDEPVFGRMLDIDTQVRRPMIHDVVTERTRWRHLRRRLKQLLRRRAAPPLRASV